MTNPAFEILDVRHIETLNVDLETYRHKRTGARHYHLKADDSNNAFLVAFLTVPSDSTGVAHILEHTALCGSESFPVRDPFFGMLKRSLQTFMNAFTASDWTAYPFATQNPKDFDNLLQVYLDAAFFPKLSELDFAQEGHRLEFENPDDLDSEIILKGVVYNEMKGAMSPPSSQVHQALQSNLFPSITYHHNSGGDPEFIPSLTHEDLKAFHRKHYHPSNAVFMTYGNFPVEKHHERFEELALRRFEHLDHGLRVQDEQRFSAPRNVSKEFAVEGDANDDESHVVLGWLLGPSADLRYNLRLHLIGSLLLEHSGSPLRMALERSTLGAAISELSGMDDETREATFTIGMEGTHPDRAQAIEDLIMAVLKQIATDGMPREEIDSCLHQLELAQREVGGDHFPYGLGLMVRGLGTAVRGGDPSRMLDMDAELDQLRADCADPAFIPGLIRELFLNNPHRVRLTMRPSATLTQTREESLRERLAALKAEMSPAALTRIGEQARALELKQDAPDDSHLLPSVGIADVPEDYDVPAASDTTIAGTPTAFYDAGTNGLSYVQLVTDMPALAPELEQHVSLFSELLTEVGCGERDYQQNQALQVAVTGGISAQLGLRAARDDISVPHQYFTLRGKALNRNSEKLVNLLTETLNAARFDELDRLRDYISQLRVHDEARLTDSGHMLALSAATDGLTPIATISERRSGLTAVAALKALDASLSDGAALKELSAQLAQVRDAFAAADRRVVAISEKEQHEAVSVALATHLPSLPATATAPLTMPRALYDTPRDVAWIVNSQVNFCAKAFLACPHSSTDTPALAVLANLLRSGFLHREIREKGGAYGGGATFDGNTGVFGYFSYRDPGLQGTLDTFDRAPDWAFDAIADDHLRESAILGVIGAMDKPGSPAGEAIGAFHGRLYGRDGNFLRNLRQQVLGVTAEDIRVAIERYLHPSAGRTAVVLGARALADWDRRDDVEVKELGPTE